ncbi:MAG: ECF-type sigma factor [Acidobacteriota bacterium]
MPGPPTDEEPAAISDITDLLDRCRDGEQECLDEVFARLYPDLRHIAVGKLARLPAGSTITPTVLVHEAYVRFVGAERLDLEGRRHFFTSAARAMRQIIVDHARRSLAAKRGGGDLSITWSEELVKGVADAGEYLDLDRALEDLATINVRGHQIVELRFFGGLTAEETAEILEISLRTVHREWVRARAYLHARLAASA